MKRTRLAGSVFTLAVVFSVCPVVVAYAQDATEEVVEEEPKEEKKEAPSTMKTVLSYALVLGGFAVIGALVVHTLTRSQRYPEARNGLIHLLRSNANHAELRCLMQPATFHEPIGAALKTGAMAQSTDLKMIATATLPTYDAIAGMVTQHWKGLVGKAKLATMAVAGGFVIGVTKGTEFPVFLLIIALASAGGLLWLFAFKTDIDRTLMRARVEVLPEVDRALAEGRYQAGPPS